MLVFNFSLYKLDLINIKSCWWLIIKINCFFEDLITSYLG